ncbi:hypothetical protein HOL21_02630 [Candidatus Woesearchaeota archaeon]|jgi:hypothetical protein|nr:hypothetical protein [Candidatus Woesearchaeota archaeon]MBT5397084.1 hypothetical protein [Candidatus Woesearchaeota archaeon]MBT6367370.1 hypothetical protein [Candidatus Woesearchaeota archaeon]MBT7762484.1 hypothetical protein [Candidatus Woesearchaeota archaeon]
MDLIRKLGFGTFGTINGAIEGGVASFFTPTYLRWTRGAIQEQERRAQTYERDEPVFGSDWRAYGFSKEVVGRIAALGSNVYVTTLMVDTVSQSGDFNGAQKVYLATNLIFGAYELVRGSIIALQKARARRFHKCSIDDTITDNKPVTNPNATQ